LIRFNPDGSLDSSFGAGGTVRTNFFGSDSLATAVRNCVIGGFSDGIEIGLSAPAQIFIQDTVIRGSVGAGITMDSSAGLIKESIDLVVVW
jgi:hypothetical protein